MLITFGTTAAKSIVNVNAKKAFFVVEICQNAFVGLSLPDTSGGAFSCPPDFLKRGKGKWENGKMRKKGINRKMEIKLRMRKGKGEGSGLRAPTFTK